MEVSGSRHAIVSVDHADERIWTEYLPGRKFQSLNRHTRRLTQQDVASRIGASLGGVSGFFGRMELASHQGGLSAHDAVLASSDSDLALTNAPQADGHHNQRSGEGR